LAVCCRLNCHRHRLHSSRRFHQNDVVVVAFVVVVFGVDVDNVVVDIVVVETAVDAVVVVIVVPSVQHFPVSLPAFRLGFQVLTLIKICKSSFVNCLSMTIMIQNYIYKIHDQQALLTYVEQ
jgi:hypothetical protein